MWPGKYDALCLMLIIIFLPDVAQGIGLFESKPKAQPEIADDGYNEQQVNGAQENIASDNTSPDSTSDTLDEGQVEVPAVVPNDSGAVDENLLQSISWNIEENIESEEEVLMSPIDGINKMEQKMPKNSQKRDSKEHDRRTEEKNHEQHGHINHESEADDETATMKQLFTEVPMSYEGMDSNNEWMENLVEQEAGISIATTNSDLSSNTNEFDPTYDQHSAVDPIILPKPKDQVEEVHRTDGNKPKINPLNVVWIAVGVSVCAVLLSGFCVWKFWAKVIKRNSIPYEQV